jgi:hypothetical protein
VEIFFKTPRGPDLDFPREPVNTFAPEKNQAPGSLPNEMEEMRLNEKIVWWIRQL